MYVNISNVWIKIQGHKVYDPNDLWVCLYSLFKYEAYQDYYWNIQILLSHKYIQLKLNNKYKI